ncbi:hypothetical protein N9937_01830 [bacterium]|nr:hypothetical protein [bacterium]
MSELHGFNMIDNEDGFTHKVPCKSCGELIEKGKVWCDESCHMLDVVCEGVNNNE